MAGVASTMDSELYKTVITIVDERIKEIKVTRKDFDDLKSVVGELAEAQKRTEIKVEELAEAQRASEARLGRLEVVVGELAEAQKRTEVTLQGLTKEVGALSRNFGFGLEDIGHVVLPGYLKRHYKIDMGEFERKFFEVNGKLVEINLFAEGRIKKEKVTILGEVKSRIYEREIKKFKRDLSRVLPLIEGRVFKLMFGYLIHPSASKIADDIELIASYQR
ncbi:MAG: hypothetical protein KAU38_15025 [Desulfobacterales bacterium]|nr:hypothetical protein [Desulfobacterales bacterium]